MVDGKQKTEWDRLSIALSMFANANRNEKKRPQPFAPNDFNPYAAKEVRRLSPKDSQRAISELLGAKKEKVK